MWKWREWSKLICVEAHSNKNHIRTLDTVVILSDKWKEFRWGVLSKNNSMLGSSNATYKWRTGSRRTYSIGRFIQRIKRAYLMPHHRSIQHGRAWCHGFITYFFFLASIFNLFGHVLPMMKLVPSGTWTNGHLLNK